MSLVFLDPHDAIRAVAATVGVDARRQLAGEIVRAWVDALPEPDLATQYAATLARLDHEDLSLLAAWHASLEVGTPLPNREFLVGVFPRLGDHRREALRIAVGFCGEDDFDAGVGEEQALRTVLPSLTRAQAASLVDEAVQLYCWDRLGGEC